MNVTRTGMIDDLDVIKDAVSLVNLQEHQVRQKHGAEGKESSGEQVGVVFNEKSDHFNS